MYTHILIHQKHVHRIMPFINVFIQILIFDILSTLDDDFF